VVRYCIIFILVGCYMGVIQAWFATVHSLDFTDRSWMVNKFIKETQNENINFEYLGMH
jgi:hypothetical protein